MPYSRPITREHPSCMLFLIDQSYSMSEVYAGDNRMTKANVVANCVNELIDIIGLKCTKGNETRHYFDMGAIFYSSNASAAFNKNSSKPNFVSIGDLYENPINLEQLDKGEEEDPVWIEPAADGTTAMCEAFYLAKTLLQEWVKQQPDSYPPTLINITDGESTDGDPSSIASKIKEIKTNDGAVLIYNIHISSEALPGFTFPDPSEILPDDYAKLLFDMASVLPGAIRERAYALEKSKLKQEARAFAFNATSDTLARCLNVGTPLNLLTD